jgi:hypothetical protein
VDDKGIYKMISRVLLAVLLGTCALAQSPTPKPESVPAKQYFIAIFSKGSAWDDRKQPNDQIGFKEHSDNLRRLRSEKRIPIGGRYGDKGMVIVEAKNEDEARSLFATDLMLEKKTFTLELYSFRPFYRGAIE